MIDDQGRFLLESVPLNDFFTAATARGRSMAEACKKTFTAAFDVHHETEVFFDKSKIRHVLDVLFACARDFAPQQAPIEFSLQDERERVVFSVKICARVEFAEADQLRSDFALASKIVERHGGELTLSDLGAQGMTISFWLPAGELAHGC